MSEIVMGFIAERPLLVTLLCLMAADITTGVLVAIGRGELASSVSFHGISRKLCMLVIIVVCAIIERHVNSLPLAAMANLLYIGVEGLSLVENAGLLGVPMPSGLVEALQKLKSHSESSSKKARKHMHFDAPSVEVKTGSAVVKGRDTDLHDTIEDCHEDQRR